MIKNKVFKGEVFFALFITAGYFKAGFNLPSFIPDLTLLFMVLSMLVVIKRIIKFPYIKKSTLISFLVFLPLPLIMILSMIYTESSIYAFEKLSKFIIITSWAYIGGIFLLKDKYSLKLFLNTLLFVSVIMGIQALFVFADNRTGFVSVFGSNYLALGRMCAVGIFILVAMCILDKEANFNKKIVAFILALVLMFTLLVSGARMPLLSIFLTLSIILPFYFFRINSGTVLVKKSIISLIITVVLGVLLIIYGLLKGLFSTTLNRLLVLVNGGGDSALGRLDRYEVALKMWSENFLLGGGVGSFPIFYLGNDISDYAHNIFLEIGSELGIIGIVSFILILLYSYFKIGKTIKYNLIPKNIAYCILLITFFLFLNANVSGDLNDNRMLFTFLGIMMVSNRYFNKKDIKRLY